MKLTLISVWRNVRVQLSNLEKTVFLFVILSIFNLSQVLLAEEINIKEFGAISDGITLNTEIIQNAIDKYHLEGGGKIIFPKGVYLTGSIVLKSNVRLHFEKDAVLLGSINPLDYIGINRWKALILSDNQSNISISGEGTINGQGRRLALNVDSLHHAGVLIDKRYNKRRKRPNELARPQIIEFVNCINIKVTGVTIKDASCWVQSYEQCRNLILDSITVDSDAYWNNDGIDIIDCKNVRVTNSYVNSADDGICLKSESENTFNDSIYIANCVVRSSASAIKFGTSSKGGFKNVKIEDIHVYDTFRSAIALESVDGGTLENIFINNIFATNTGNAIFIRLGHRNKGGEVGILKDVRIENMRVQVPYGVPDIEYEIRGPELPFFHNPFPASITGIPGHYVENVSLENIEIIYPGRGNNGFAYLPLNRLDDVPENESDYPEFHMFGELPAWAFYVRHVKDLFLKDVFVRAEKPDYRPAYVFDDVINLKLKDIKVVELGEKKQIVLRNIKKPEIDEQINVEMITK